MKKYFALLVATLFVAMVIYGTLGYIIVHFVKKFW